MRRLSFLFAICMIINFCACSSSSDETQNISISIDPRTGTNTAWYEFISGQSSSGIDLMCYNTVHTNSDSSDSLLVFTGVKNNKLWVEGYHANAKDWLAKDVVITEGKLPWQVTKVFSWVDNEDVDREIRYRNNQGDIITDSLQYTIPITVFGLENNKVIYYFKKYGTTGKYGIKFTSTGKAVESINGCYWWTNNYLFTSSIVTTTMQEKYECYSFDGKFQFSTFKNPYSYIGISNKYGLFRYSPQKVNMIDDTIVWSITEEQICQKLGLVLGEKDELVVSYDSKESETVYVYNVKVQWDDLYKGDENYKIRVNVDTGELL